MSDFWFTSDWHLLHQRIIELCGRPFADVDEMTEQLVQRYNAVVRPDDVCWFIGDMCMGPIDESLAVIKRLNGRKYLISGNHDRCFHGYGDNAVNKVQLDAWLARYRHAGFDLVTSGYTVRRRGFGEVIELKPVTYGTGGRRVAGVVAELCHFPTTGESRPGVEDRFAEYRPRPLGLRDHRPSTKRWVLCGHVHDAWTSSGRNLNVGVDVWDFAPVHQDELAAWIVAAEREYGAALDDPATSTTVGPARPPTRADGSTAVAS